VTSESAAILSFSGKTVEVFHILRPEMDRSGSELLNGNSFTKKHWKLNEKKTLKFAVLSLRWNPQLPVCLNLPRAFVFNLL
jgi:hypothetical protein